VAGFLVRSCLGRKAMETDDDILRRFKVPRTVRARLSAEMKAALAQALLASASPAGGGGKLA
jgi:hypothetical protein